MHIKSAKFVRGIKGTDKIVYEEKKQIAFIGRSNVGKSSLINCITNNDNLVKTSSKPGKTKELNYFLINNQFYFIDLPGYGYAKASLAEREQLRKMILWFLVYNDKTPDLTILIFDANVGLTEIDLEMIQMLNSKNSKYILVANKIDKANQSLKSQLQKQFKNESVVFFSTIKDTKLYTKELLNLIEQNI